MAQKKYTDGSGVSEIWLNVKNYVYSQLLGKSDVGHTHSASDITSGLATVATSGSYNDLSNKPTIPTVNNATLTIQKNGTTVKTFTANASSNATANITVPTKVSELNNDSNFVRSLNNHMDLSWDTPVSGKLNIKVDQSWLGGILTTANTTIPTKTSDLTNDSNFIASAIKESGNISTSFWCLLYGDLLIQWGSAVFDGQGTLTFSKPFAEKPWVVMSYGDTAAYGSPCAERGSTNTYLSATNQSGGVWRCNWIAIGKKGY